MRPGFQIRHWAALAPGLREAGDWQAWARHPVPPAGALEAPLAAMPAMQRRRVERVGRLALEVAYAVDGQGEAPDFARRPMVFASRHGDVLRSVGLLEALDRGEPLSPTQFGLSVHNAVAAQYGIARGSTAPYSAVAGGRCSAEAGLWEALAYLDEGHDEVLLVVFDEPPPALFARDADEPAIPFAWALRIAPAAAGGFQLQPGAGAGEIAAPEGADLPHGLAVLAYLLAPTAAWAVEADDGGWCWRHAG
ncbi:beta-ketoacyl synthase chain length factor [Silanimonas lenta]|uniref:beta-ketoacyl synthase chain length factor n=1 Tax=Silanimonas lenta TaxID=265429 RepID=UPI00042893C2|nr:beta-ketoacyl synthase chain length factor [Silanimonas lenta]